MRETIYCVVNKRLGKFITGTIEEIVHKIYKVEFIEEPTVGLRKRPRTILDVEFQYTVPKEHGGNGLTDRIDFNSNKLYNSFIYDLFSELKNYGYIYFKEHTI